MYTADMPGISPPLATQCAQMDLPSFLCFLAHRMWGY